MFQAERTVNAKALRKRHVWNEHEGQGMPGV